MQKENKWSHLPNKYHLQTKCHFRTKCYMILQSIAIQWQISCRHSQLYHQHCRFILFDVRRKYTIIQYFKATLNSSNTFLLCYHRHIFAPKNIFDSRGLGFAEFSHQMQIFPSGAILPDWIWPTTTLEIFRFSLWKSSDFLGSQILCDLAFRPTLVVTKVQTLMYKSELEN